MKTTDIQLIIESALPGARAIVTGDGHHFETTVTYAGFAGLSKMKQQQLVLSTVKDRIASGELHALSVKTRLETA